MNASGTSSSSASDISDTSSQSTWTTITTSDSTKASAVPSSDRAPPTTTPAVAKSDAEQDSVGSSTSTTVKRRSEDLRDFGHYAFSCLRHCYACGMLNFPMAASMIVLSLGCVSHSKRYVSGQELAKHAPEFYRKGAATVTLDSGESYRLPAKHKLSDSFHTSLTVKALVAECPTSETEIEASAWAKYRLRKSEVITKKDSAACVVGSHSHLWNIQDDETSLEWGDTAITTLAVGMTVPTSTCLWMGCGQPWETVSWVSLGSAVTGTIIYLWIVSKLVPR